MTWEHYRRLEPVPPYTDLQRGFSAELADPVWMLGRQWQVGEHAGEDASSPVLAEVPVAHTPLEPVAGLDPVVVPAEALLEGSAEDWWTIGRRVRVGRALAGTLSPEQRAAAAFGVLPEPYGDTFYGEVDGLALARAGLVDPAHPAVAGLSGRPDFWQPRTLTYECRVPVAGTHLQVSAHDGGDVDWYTADATGPLPAPALETRHVLPQRLQYPGAPGPRWWQIEDSAVDIGGFPPDRAHLATALLIELICDHANDWFTFPVPAPRPRPGQDPPPTSGVVVGLGRVRVKDGFDDWWDLTVPPGAEDPPAGPDEAPGPWSLFRTAGLDRASLVVWPTATTPLTGPVLDDVLLGVDEDANLLWAVELRADGHDRALSEDSAAALEETRRTGTREFTWLPSTTLPEHWHPYRIEHRSSRVFVQGLVDGRDLARSELLGAGDGHVLEATAVPNQGMRLERRYVLARGTDGRPVLWRRRHRLPLLAGPVSHLRFDLLKEGPAS
ncbi:hypothetical protein [Nonomuraea maritima]|uniref:hypothetical protein n=1 Tax=Nonomuraea maritima TaxID=683260 RepID=UPI00371264E4